jgi:hypothetical protein
MLTGHSARARLPGNPRCALHGLEPHTRRAWLLPDPIRAERPHARKRRQLIPFTSALVRLALAVVVGGLPTLVLAQSITLPGEFGFRTKKGYYLTAVNGGGRSAAPTIITASTSAGPWEKFRIVVGNPAPPYDKSFQTATGNYVTAVNGGGMTADALHTDATQVRAWGQFRMNDLSQGNFAPTYYAITTIGAGTSPQSELEDITKTPSIRTACVSIRGSSSDR